MYESITRSQLFVLDQDQALDFYVNTLGLEVSADLDLGFMRWLTVCLPGDASREILLEVPGPPAMDGETAAAVRDLVTKGAMGGWLCITTPVSQSTYQTLRDRGVDNTAEPSPKP
jgi:catechol 2,3-dioxygenase-like lactoylglutathione lyase family enzyme